MDTTIKQQMDAIATVRKKFLLRKELSQGLNDAYSSVRALEFYLELFPNDFDSWHKTHFEIVRCITFEWVKTPFKRIVAETQASHGQAGVYSLAYSLTNKFENLHKGETWKDKNFLEEIEKFIQQELQ